VSRWTSPGAPNEPVVGVTVSSRRPRGGRAHRRGGGLPRRVPPVPRVDRPSDEPFDVSGVDPGGNGGSGLTGCPPTAVVTAAKPGFEELQDPLPMDTLWSTAAGCSAGSSPGRWRGSRGGGRAVRWPRR